MKTRFDILKEDPPGEYLWLEAVATLDLAASRAETLAAGGTGRIIIFDQEMQAKVPLPQSGAARA